MAAGVVDRVTLAEAIESDALQAMRCPVCTSLHTAIRKSDPLANGTVNRYRTCRNCGKRFTTNHADSRLQSAVAYLIAKGGSSGS